MKININNNYENDAYELITVKSVSIDPVHDIFSLINLADT